MVYGVDPGAYYYANGKRIYLVKDEESFVVRFGKGVSEQVIDDIVVRHGLQRLSWPETVAMPGEYRIFGLKAGISGEAGGRIRQEAQFYPGEIRRDT